jgi:hypothetical protein
VLTLSAVVVAAAPIVSPWAADSELAKESLLTYEAVTESVPGEAYVVVQLACPELSTGAVQRAPASPVKVTVPEAVAWLETGVTVAVKVTVSPTTGVASLVDNDVVVPTGPEILIATELEVEPRKLPSPW